MRSLRIAIDIRAPDSSAGQQRYLWRLGNWLQAGGHDVHFLCLRRSVAPPGLAAPPAFHALGGQSRSGLHRTVMEIRPDVLLVNPERAWPYRGIGVNVLRPGYGTQQYRQNLRSFRGAESWLRRALRVAPWTLVARARERRFYTRGPILPDVIAVSRYMEREILDSYPVPSDHVHVVLNGVDLEEFSPGNREELRDGERRRWNIPPDAVCILFMGHNFRLKGLWDTLRDVAALRREGRDIHLLVAGRGTGRIQRRKARRLTATLGLSDVVHLAGPIRPAVRAFAAADFLLFPSWHDSFGFVVLEAMACGLPVITTRYAGASEIIDEGESGFLVAPEDREGVRERIRSLCERELRVGMGAAARRAAEPHGEEANFRSVERVFRTAAARRQGPVT